MDDFLKSFFGNKTLEEVEAENKAYEAKLIEENPPLILPFGNFAKGNYDEGHRNLYIVWRGKQALYVGIATSGIWNRWFARGGQSHILINAGGHWIADYSSTIGRVIVRNRPAAMRWKIELRYIPCMNRWDLQSEEAKLIHELHPLFNSTYLPDLTEKERKIYKRLTTLTAAEEEAMRNAVLSMSQLHSKD